jgi:hypothetical protein
MEEHLRPSNGDEASRGHFERFLWNRIYGSEGSKLKEMHLEPEDQLSGEQEAVPLA